MLTLFGYINAQEIITIDGTVGNLEQGSIQYVPIYNNYEYAVTQQYYTAEEIGKSSGTIESISFRTSDDEVYPYTRTIEVYMINTENYHFGVGGKVMEQVSAADLVFSGSVEFTKDAWITIDLNTDFEYTGKNLMVCVNDHTGVFVSTGSYFKTFVSTYELPYQGDTGLARRALYARDMYTAFDPTASAITAYATSQYVPFIQLAFAEGTTEEYLDPATPANFVATAMNESKIQLTWDAAENAQSYNVYCDTELLDNVTETSYMVKNLTEIKEYCFSVKAVNGTKESEAAEACATLVAKELGSVLLGTIGEVDASAVPFGNNVKYSWIESIYKAEEIARSCTIERLSFARSAGEPVTFDEINIYLAETDKEDFGATPEWTAEEDLTLVYSDTDVIIGDQEWETFEFDTPFQYSGKKNLAVVIAKESENTTQLLYWYCEEMENGVCIASDNEDPSFAQYPVNSGTAYKKRAVMRLSWTPGTDAPVDPELPDDVAVLIDEKFNGFESGDKIAEKGSAWWTTWLNKPGTNEDGVVSEINGDKCAYFSYNVDQILLLGGEQSGVYDLEFDILVEEGKNAYFNVLHDFKGSNSTWAMETHLHLLNSNTSAPGKGYVKAGGVEKEIVCVYDSWMHFRLHVDTDADKAQYYYTIPESDSEEIFVCEWQWSKNSEGTEVVGRKLDAMNFFPPKDASSEFYMDNFLFTKIGGESFPIVGVDKESLETNAYKDDVVSVEFNIENTGTSVAEYVAWIDYGMGEISATENTVNYDKEPDNSTTSAVGLVVEEPTLVEIGAMYPAESYGNSVAGTRITHLKYPFFPLTINNSIGIVEGTPVTFRIYGQGLYGQPGELLAEKVLDYEEILPGDWTVAEFDEPVLLTGFDVWATVSFIQKVSTEEDPNFPIMFDGSEEYIPFGDMIRKMGEGPFKSANENFGQNYGNIHIRMICKGEPALGGWASLSSKEGALPINAEETVTVELTTIGLEEDTTYEANVVLLTNDIENAKIEIPLSLYIQKGDNIDEMLSNTYNIYPNPTNSHVMVEGENINYIAIYNSVGQLVNVVKNQDNIVDMSAYENGIYFFNIVDNSGQNSLQRVVVAR